MAIVAIIYFIASYWATGVIHDGEIWIGTRSNMFLKRLIEGLLFGVILIPIAIIKTIVKNRS